MPGYQVYKMLAKQSKHRAVMATAEKGKDPLNVLCLNPTAEWGQKEI